jgi:transcriptional regulator GlxA family with amidase domain
VRVAVVTLDGFNELDSFVASTILGRVQQPDWSVAIASPTPQVTSMNGVTITAQMPLDEIGNADAVIVGSGVKTRDYAADHEFLATLRLDPTRQLIGSQCSGALLLAKLGLLDGVPVCTDLTTKPWVIEAGADVIDRPFFASGNVATAGGCLSSQYLAAWVIMRLVDAATACDAIHYVAPVGEKDEYVERAMNKVLSFAGPALSTPTRRSPGKAVRFATRSHA